MRGKLIVIEGIDGSGKGTQTGMVVDRMKREGIPVAKFSFPRYEETFFGRLVGRELKGEFGGLKEISPYLFSLPFAFDRWESKPEINDILDSGTHVLLDRYSLSNAAHQTPKLPPEKRMEFLKFLQEMEYEKLKIPKEDLNIFLLVSAEKGQELVGLKGKREYLGAKVRDIQEEDLNHLAEASKVYQELARIMPNIVTINCCQEGQIMTKETIHEMVWKEVAKTIQVPHEGRVVRDRQF